MEMEHTRDEFFMQQALAEARQALQEEEVPVGAVVVCRDRIIARAHNLVERLCDPTAHAEMQAFTAAAAVLGGKYLSDCTLYVTVEPCPMCAAAAAWCQVGRIVYGASDLKRGYTTVSAKLLHPKTLVEAGLLAEPAAALMREFFKTLRA